MKVYKPGLEVRLAPRIVAKILSVEISTDSVRYRVVWWDEYNRKTEWLRPEEILGPAHERDYPHTTDIGFITT